VGADRQAARARYVALFDRAGDAIVLLDPGTGVVLAANAQAERLATRFVPGDVRVHTPWPAVATATAAGARE